MSAAGEALTSGPCTTTYDPEGHVTSRSWASGVVQTLAWDAFGRLIRVGQRDTQQQGWDWTAGYDGLGRRLTSTYQPVGATLPPTVATQTRAIFDPQVEFLEIGLSVNGAKGWQVYGPDRSGRYGGWQGTGGLEATIVETGSATTGVLNDQFGNGVAAVNGTTTTWFATRVGGYGPLPGICTTPADHSKRHEPRITSNPPKIRDSSKQK